MARLSTPMQWSVLELCKRVRACDIVLFKSFEGKYFQGNARGGNVIQLTYWPR
jgi:hypothetical protein